jgi:hypothetical protein
MTCAQRHHDCVRAVEILGIPLPGRAHDRAFTWESAGRSLCIRENRDYPHAAPQRTINEPNIYHGFIAL